MRPLFYSINLSLDGCYDHEAIPADEELHRYAAESMGRADTLLFGRVIYQMMEAAFRLPDQFPAGDQVDPFAVTIHAAKKYVVSSTLECADWNAELIREDLREAVLKLKGQPGKGIFTGGVTLPMALAEMDLIDEYEFIIHPVIVGRGPAIFSGLVQRLDLKLVGKTELNSGAIALRYEPK